MTSSISLPPDLPERLAVFSKEKTRYEGLGMPGQNLKPRAAAVLLPLIYRHDKWQLIYTLRSNKLHDHSGQVSFPGGACDPEDKDVVATALREAWEEIGLEPKAVQVQGRLPSLNMVTRFVVTPVVGIVDWPVWLTINPDEVGRVFSVPLDWLANPDNQSYRVHSHGDEDFNVPYFQRYDGELIWGATAIITLDFLKVLGIK